MRVRTHPGEVLKEEFLVRMGITEGDLAAAVGVPESVIGGIVQQRRGVNADIALRLSRYFGTSAEFWCNLQNAYDLSAIAATKKDDLERNIPHRPSVEMANLAVPS
ncbi:MAG: HigA family addiction module antidote protein [Desulfovibrio sp.]|nr:HigA family addiction module antidote protein [Desulfovibrio sp.]